MTIDQFIKTSALGVSLIALAACASTDATRTSVAQAETPSVAEAAAFDTADADENGMVCRRVKRTGTNFKRKVCYSMDELRTMREYAKRGMERLAEGSSSGCYDGQC
ncbi:MAG: hypothetical protein WBG08_01950 [Litorimonas sp.]